jgi:hypothetical protein
MEYGGFVGIGTSLIGVFLVAGQTMDEPIEPLRENEVGPFDEGTLVEPWGQTLLCAVRSRGFSAGAIPAWQLGRSSQWLSERRWR